MKCSLCSIETITVADVTYCPCCGLVVEKTMEVAVNKGMTFQELVNKYEEVGESC